MRAHAVIFCALLWGALGARDLAEGSRLDPGGKRSGAEDQPRFGTKLNEKTDSFNEKQIDISQLKNEEAFRALLSQFNVKDISPLLGADGLAQGIGKDGQSGIQVKVLDSDDPATEELIRKVLRENGQTKTGPGEVIRKPKVQTKKSAESSKTTNNKEIAAEVDHREEPVLIKFINLEHEDSEQDFIERILKSKHPESFYEKQDYLSLEGDDSPWSSLLKNSVNITQNLIDPNTQSSDFSPDIIESVPKLVSPKSSETISSFKVLGQNVKKLRRFEEGPCQIRIPTLQEVESAMSVMTLSPDEKPKAEVVLDIIKTINSKSDEEGIRENTAGVKTLSKSSADTDESGDEVADNKVNSSVASFSKSSIDIGEGTNVKPKDGFVVADSNGSEQDVRIQVLYLGEPETEAFIQSVLQMDESELLKNTKFTILKESQDPQKDLQLEVVDNERLRKLVKYEQPLGNSNVIRDWFNFENITKTTVQVLKPENAKQKKQYKAKSSQSENKITHQDVGKLQRERSNDLVSPAINQAPENQKESSKEILQGIKSVNTGSLLGNRVKESQKENFKKIVIGVHKLDTIKAASSINAEERRNSNTIKTNAKPLKEIAYSESVLDAPNNSTNGVDESSYEIDEWLENTSQYRTASFLDENFTTPQNQEEETFAPTEPQEDRFDVNDINGDGVPMALFFKKNDSTKRNYDEADEPQTDNDSQDMFTAETSGFPVTFIAQALKKENVNFLKAETDDLTANNSKEDSVKVQNDKDDAPKAQKDKEEVLITLKHKGDAIKAQKYKNDVFRAKEAKKTAPKDQNSYGEMLRDLGVTDQSAEDEEKIIEAAMNFEQKHMDNRMSRDTKEKLKGIDQVARTKAQIDRRIRRKARAIPNDRRQNPNHFESNRRQKSNYPDYRDRLEGPNRLTNRQPISDADSNGPAAWLRYYRHPIEAHRFDYQSIVRQTRDYGEPITFNLAYFRPNHGYGFNEWGGLGAAP